MRQSARATIEALEEEIETLETEAADAKAEARRLRRYMSAGKPKNLLIFRDGSTRWDWAIHTHHNYFEEAILDDFDHRAIAQPYDAQPTLMHFRTRRFDRIPTAGYDFNIWVERY